MPRHVMSCYAYVIVIGLPVSETIWGLYFLSGGSKLHFALVTFNSPKAILLGSISKPTTLCVKLKNSIYFINVLYKTIYTFNYTEYIFTY